jgi:peroxiredoxin
MKLERVLQILIGALLIALIVVVSGTMRERIVVAGDSAPDFKITADNGRQISRTNFGGKVLVLNFWATWCPPCIEEIPSLDAMQKQLANSGVVVLAVSVDKNEKAYKDFLSRAGVTFTTSRDPEANVSAEYGTFKYPETYVIDRNGKVVQKIIGPTDWTDAKMVSYIRSLL